MTMPHLMNCDHSEEWCLACVKKMHDELDRERDEALRKLDMQRYNLTQPPDWMEAFRNAAQKAGLSLSEWMGEQCRAALPKKEQAKLSERPPAHRPKLTDDRPPA